MSQHGLAAYYRAEASDARVLTAKAATVPSNVALASKVLIAALLVLPPLSTGLSTGSAKIGFGLLIFLLGLLAMSLVGVWIGYWVSKFFVRFTSFWSMCWVLFSAGLMFWVVSYFFGDVFFQREVDPLDFARLHRAFQYYRSLLPKFGALLSVSVITAGRITWKEESFSGILKALVWPVFSIWFCVAVYSFAF